MKTDEQVLERAAHAKRLLDDELFQEAVLEARERILAAWEVAATSEVRESLHYQLYGLTTVMQIVRTILDDGEILKTRLEKQERR